MSNYQKQTDTPKKSRKDALQQYLMDPRNGVDFDENFDYDNVDYSNMSYDALILGFNPTMLPASDLREAFESVDANKAARQVDVNVDQLLPRIDENPRYDRSVSDSPAIDLHCRVFTTEDTQAQLEKNSAQFDAEVPSVNSDVSTTPDLLVASVPVAGLMFANRAHARQAFSQRNVPHNWQPPQNDTTVPQFLADRQQYVAQLMAAFADISQCQDSDAVLSLQERWTGILQGHSSYTSEQMETVCWKLLEIAENLHRWGPGSLHIYDQSKFKLIYKSRTLKFAERIELLCDLMRLSKARCVTFLGFDDLEMTVGSPAHVITMTKINKRQNQKRQELIVEGRAELKAKKHAVVYQHSDIHTHDVELSTQAIRLVQGPGHTGFVNQPNSRFMLHQRTLDSPVRNVAASQRMDPSILYPSPPKQGVKRRRGD